MMHNSTNRFADRVENYVKFRPRYPGEFVNHLIIEQVLKQDTIVADVGSGTGFSAQPILEYGNTVYGVEPNEPMRSAGEKFLAQYVNFISIDGTAEQTTLPNNSVDLVIAGQAFHWFDQDKCKTEFQRILKPAGHLLLMWNERLTVTTPFLTEYENLLLKHSTDYTDINHINITPKLIAEFFSPNRVEKHEIENIQTVDYDGLEGRLMSCSYVPNYGEEGHEAMLTDLRMLYEQFEVNGKLDFIYLTRMYYGLLAS